MSDARALLSEIARLKVELADAERQAKDAQLAVQIYCDDYNRVKAELDIAEQATRKAMEAMPVAMDAAVEKEREACAKIVDGFSRDICREWECTVIASAIRARTASATSISVPASPVSRVLNEASETGGKEG